MSVHQGPLDLSLLSDGICIPCSGGVPPLKGNELVTFHEKLVNNSYFE